MSFINEKYVVVPCPVGSQAEVPGCFTTCCEVVCWWSGITAGEETVNVMSDEKHSKQSGFYHQDEPFA